LSAEAITPAQDSPGSIEHGEFITSFVVELSDEVTQPKLVVSLRKKPTQLALALFYLICQRGSTITANSQTAVLGKRTERVDSAKPITLALNSVISCQRQGCSAT